MLWIRAYLIGFGLMWLFSILWSGSYQQDHDLYLRLLVGIGSIFLGLFSKRMYEEAVIQGVVILISGAILFASVLLVLLALLKYGENVATFSILVAFHMFFVGLVMNIALSRRSRNKNRSC